MNEQVEKPVEVAAVELGSKELDVGQTTIVASTEIRGVEAPQDLEDLFVFRRNKEVMSGLTVLLPTLCCRRAHTFRSLFGVRFGGSIFRSKYGKSELVDVDGLGEEGR